VSGKEIPGVVASYTRPDQLARSTLVGFAEEKKLCLVVYGEHTSASYPTEDVRPSTLEE
jgi:hypothetical protein